MAMNFYQHQDRARRRSVHLLVYFALAVVLLVAAVNAVLYLIMRTQASAPQDWLSWLYSAYGGWTSALVLGLVSGGSVYTTLRLAGGGKALAAMLGARALTGPPASSSERQLRNVVEEMSIASGTPVPTLYVLDHEAGINAFVAGTRPTEAVLVVTRGALDAFTRDELQGVVAHEYSHILHQDMRINMRLMGILAGILLLSRLGRSLMRAGDAGDGKSAGQFALFGLALFLIGYLGVLLGALIQAAVSRQREFLADASAVQFTRNPDGIAAALYRIAHGGGSRLVSAHAADLAHFCFAASVGRRGEGWFASHPPLAVRIAAIAPHFVASGSSPNKVRAARDVPREERTPTLVPGAAFAPAAVAETVGHFAPREQAAAALDAIPAILRDAARGEQAVPLIYALLLASTPNQNHHAALAAVSTHEAAASARQVASLLPCFADLTDNVRLPLLNLALPRLKTLSPHERLRLRTTVSAIIEADGRLSFCEFALQRILEDHLADGAGRAVPVRHFKFAAVAASLRVVCASLAWEGARDAASAATAFQRAYLPFSVGMAVLPARDSVTPQLLGPALAELAALTPLLKRNVIAACADCALEDGRLQAREAELLQAMALSLDCPLPPLAVTHSSPPRLSRN